MEVKNKNVVVIGGVRGIGLACVKEFLKHDAKKVIVIDYDESLFEEVKNDISQRFSPSRVSIYKADISNGPEFEEVFKEVIHELTTIDILHCNAGIFGEEIWRKIIEVNLIGTTHAVYMGLKHMSKENGGAGGAIIITASTAGLTGVMGSLSTYCASKAGLIGLTRSFENEEQTATSGVRVMAICPGPTKTPILTEGNLYTKPLPDEIPDIAKTMYFQEPEAVAKGVIYMVRNAVSGTVYATEDEKTYKVDLPDYYKNELKKTQVV